MGARFFPTLLPLANFYGALALCQMPCQALEPKKERSQRSEPECGSSKAFDNRVCLEGVQ